MECRYCRHFQKGQIKHLKDRPNQRFCIPIDEWKNKDDISCDGDFKLAESFWCDAFSCRIATPVCIWRQKQIEKSYYKDCFDCPQGNDVRYAAAIRVVEEEKPTMVRRKKPTMVRRKKPTMVRRKNKHMVRRNK